MYFTITTSLLYRNELKGQNSERNHLSNSEAVCKISKVIWLTLTKKDFRFFFIINLGASIQIAIIFIHNLIFIARGT